MNELNKYFQSGFAATVILLASCGGGGGGVAGTGQTSSGSISGFGSVFVNGVEHDINAASCDVDGEDRSGDCQANLSIGMVVTLTGRVDGATGVAESLVFDSDIEGPVSNLVTDADGLTKRFDVFDKKVLVDSSSTVFDDSPAGFSFATLADGNVVEVSGFFNSTDNVLEASFIERKAAAVQLGTTEVELKGTVTGAVGGAGFGENFMLGAVTVNIGTDSTATDLSDMPGNVVNNGDFVEVKGVLNALGQIDATKVEPEREGIGAVDDNVSLEGLVSGFGGNLSSFQVSGQTVDASSATFQPAALQLEDGLKIEVEGTINSNGVLVATRVEARGNDIKVDAKVGGIGVNELTLQLGNGSLTVQVNNRTRMEDKTDQVSVLTLANLVVGDFVEIRGFLDAGAIVASELRRDEADDHILQGPVASVVANNSITVLGISFSVDGDTDYEGADDLSISAADFFDTDRTGTMIKIKDKDPDGAPLPDGVADEVDVEG